MKASPWVRWKWPSRSGTSSWVCLHLGRMGAHSSPDVGGRVNIGRWKDWQSIRKTIDWSTAPGRNSSQDINLSKNSSSEASQLLDHLLEAQYWWEMAKRSEAQPWKTSNFTLGSPDSEHSQSWQGPNVASMGWESRRPATKGRSLMDGKLSKGRGESKRIEVSMSRIGSQHCISPVLGWH